MVAVSNNSYTRRIQTVEDIFRVLVYDMYDLYDLYDS